MVSSTISIVGENTTTILLLLSGLLFGNTQLNNINQQGIKLAPINVNFVQKNEESYVDDSSTKKFDNDHSTTEKIKRENTRLIICLGLRRSTKQPKNIINIFVTTKTITSNAE